MSMNLGVMIAFLLAEFLPEDTDTVALKETELWRIAYFWLPGCLYLIILFAYMFTIKYDSIKNLIQTNNLLEAELFLK